VKRKGAVWFVVIVAMCVMVPLVAEAARLVVSWKNPAYTGGKPARVLVIGMSQDPAIRADFEDDMAAALAKDGVDVTPGNHILLRPDSPDMDENYLKGQIRDHKIDGVLTSRLVSVENSTTYFSGSSIAIPYRYYNTLWGYYGTVYHQVYTPGYLRNDTSVRIETNFYSTATEGSELIWTGTSESFNPRSAKDTIKGVVKTVAKELKKKNLI
jgi:hypothetical protein